MTQQAFRSALRPNTSILVDWSKAKDAVLFRQAPDRRYPVIITYKDGSFKLGHVVTPDLDEWATAHSDVFRIDVQIGTRFAFKGEETDLF